MNIPWKRLASIALTALLSALSPHVQGSESGITVSGTGEVLAKPTRVEIDLSAGAAAELTGDAIVKYQDSLRRTLDAFKKMQLKNLTIEQRSLSFQSTSGAAAANAFAQPGRAPSTAKSQIDITRALRIVLTETDKLSEQELMETIGKLLDAAKDAGAKIGDGASNALMLRMMGQSASSIPVVTFVVEDVAAAREKAYQQAFDQAKARAARLSNLAGQRLGRVESVEEGLETNAKDESGVQEKMITAIYGISSNTDNEESRLTSQKLADIPVRVTLRVRFALEEEPAAAASSGLR
ncbi:MAG TPA: SIMPL domain-containing protein [Pirellulales bacterium]|nr:SIMPL domain-containing protein [Pirellulales bacterium]